MLKRLITTLISILMIIAMAPVVPGGYAAAESSPASDGYVLPEEGTYVPGEVMVMFRTGAVKDSKLSLRKAKKLDNIDDDFGMSMEATGEETEAAKNAKSEVEIIRESLGDDFVIKDSISFDDDFTVALVASDKYDTETMIQKLSANDRVESAEANTYTEKQSYDYSLNDALNSYCYQTNSPQADNKSGDDVSTRGYAASETISTNAGSAWAKYKPAQNDEVVVAVIDSGVNTDHEDLRNMLWTNPGNIGLEGEHGFNFADNAADITDGEGHGSHCAGLIAAEANNGKGVAGVASGVNVKVMMLSKSTVHSGGDADRASYVELGGFNYALKAKQRGVNVVAISNSWCNPGRGDIYDGIVERLGEEGVITFFAAGNEHEDLDKVSYYGSGSYNKYQISVGAAKPDGKPAGFSNYGKSTVELFAPGTNLLSAACESMYNPNLYTAEERAQNTDYYGQFNSNIKITEGDASAGTYDSVIPDTAGEGVNAFGASVFVKQKQNSDDGQDAGGDISDAAPELEIATDKYFTTTGKASLKLTIKGAVQGEEYFFFFPYEKNEGTTGGDNTKFAINTILNYEEGDAYGNIEGGEISKNEDGSYEMTGYGGGSLTSEANTDDEVLQCQNSSKSSGKELLSWDEVKPQGDDSGKEVGMGLKITAGYPYWTDDALPPPEGPADITVYIDSLGVSLPFDDPQKQFPAESSYTVMSGTSMACPVAAGAYAVMAALNPQKEGQSGAEYAMENRARFLSSVTEDDDLRDLCQTGGWLDLSKVGSASAAEPTDTADPSITDAVCNTEKGTLTLSGIHFTPDLKLSFIRLAQKKSKETTISSDRISFAKDGSSITISNAKPLFGTYTEFILRGADDSVKARSSFFTVRGQKKLKKVMTEKDPVREFVSSWHFKERTLLTDSKGSKLYAYDPRSGTVASFDGNQFTDFAGTDIKDALADYYIKNEHDKNGGNFDRYQVDNDLKVSVKAPRYPLYGDETLYAFVDAAYTPSSEAADEDSEIKHWLASINFTAKDPAWSFREIRDFEKKYGLNAESSAYAVFKGKILIFGSSEGLADIPVYAYDIKTGKWSKGKKYADSPLQNAFACVKDGKVWLMFGSGADNKASVKVLSYDGSVWTRHADIPFVGRMSTSDITMITGAAAAVRDGFVMMNVSADGAGNIFLYNTKTDKCKPMYYTVDDSLSDNLTNSSAVETKEGIYFYERGSDEVSQSFNTICMLPASSGAYKTSYNTKAVNTLKVKAKTVTVKYKQLKKKTQTVKRSKAISISGAKGTVTYVKASGNKKISVNKKTGKITVRKKLKKGTYKLKVKVKAAGNSRYKSVTKKVTVKIKVK